MASDTAIMPLPVWGSADARYPGMVREIFPGAEAKAAPDPYIYRYRCTCPYDPGGAVGPIMKLLPCRVRGLLPRFRDDRLTSSPNVPSWVALCFGLINVSSQRLPRS